MSRRCFVGFAVRRVQRHEPVMTDVAARLAAALEERYRIERALGRGAMATVYLAEDVKHHRRVAIKVLTPELAESLGTERFLREIETTANLRHPHILPLYDSGSIPGGLFYVMDNADLSASLTDLMKGDTAPSSSSSSSSRRSTRSGPR